MEAGRNQSLDDFFQDFNEIISSEMNTSSQGVSSATIDMVPYSDHSKPFNSNVSGADFNLDLSQFYVNTSESDFLSSMLQPPDLKADYSTVMIQHPTSQFNATYQDKVIDDQLQFSVLDSSEGRNTADVQFIDNYHDTVFDDHLQFSIIDHPNESQQGTEYFHNNTKVSDNTQCNQFYVDFKLNNEVTSASNEDNSIVTYISKDALQSVEYINESGQTETVMYVDQQSDMNNEENNGSCVTQYEIIDFDSYQYPNQNDSTFVELSVPTNNQPQFYEETLEIGHQADILSTLLSDKNNKIVIIAKPLKNPKVKQPIDDFYLKLEEIDNNPTNISFVKRPRVKGCRKQKLETINQIELVEKKRGRPQIKKQTISTTTSIPETPYRPSKFVRDRKSKMQVRRKRPRKLTWDSESDWENTENCTGADLTD